MDFDVKKFLGNLPDLPGVYQMFDHQDQVIYVGKALNLKNRLRSYFQKNLANAKTAALMKQVDRIEITITDSENAALLLEWNLIKQHQPRYNVLLRDDKSYPYLYLSTQQKFPRLDYHRGAKRAPGRYFGPYPNAGSLRESLQLIQKLFRLRQCNDTFFANRTRPCLQYQIKRCTAPCVSYVSESEYAEQVENAILFLEGKNNEIISRLGQKMDDAASQLQFEEAANYRDVIVRLRRLQTQQSITGDKGDVDIIGASLASGTAAVAIVFVRSGRVIGNKSFFLQLPPGAIAEDVLEEFVSQYYLSPLRGEQVVDRIVLCQKLRDKKFLQTALQQHLGKRLVISDKPLAQYKQWQAMASANAEYAMNSRLAERSHVSAKLLALQKALRLPQEIARIECFDISHTMGEATVASCVVYGSEGSIKKDYRRFNITDVTPGDDISAKRQAVTRRYTRVKENNAPLPDLIIIDGGVGQLTAAAGALEEVQVTGVALMGVAKGAARKPGLEQIFLSGREHPLDMKENSLAFHLIQFVRDEAHRFAIEAHRGQRGKARSQSPIQDIPNVGAKRRQALLRYFGGWQELSRASVDDIAKVPGISVALAQKIYDALR